MVTTDATSKPAEVELMEISDRRVTSKVPGGRTTKLWMILAIVFLVISLALAIYIIHMKVSDQKESKSREEVIILRFPGFFRTPEEQVQFEEQYLQMAQNESRSADIANETNFEATNCSFSCYGKGSNRTRRHAHASMPLMHFSTIYSVVHALTRRAAYNKKGVNHACCVSSRTFICPETAETILGEVVKIVRLDGRRQYFITETCKHVKGCTGCTCQQETTVTAAVVLIPTDDEDDITIDYIKLPGCCKCINGGDAAVPQF